MNKKCTRVAIGGVFSALCLLLMFLTGVFPFSNYVMPVIASAMLAVVSIENGRGAAMLVYASVSLLSLFIVPDMDAKLVFICFFGYYPVLKDALERVRVRPVQYALKLLAFNVAIVAGYLVAARLLGLGELVEEMGEFGEYTVYVLLLMGNVVFLLYDYILTKYTLLYKYRFKPRYLRR